MKISSSKNKVENKLDILSKIEKVRAPNDMLDNILSSIETRKKNTISLTWIKSAAAAIIILISVESYLLLPTVFKGSSETNYSIEAIVPVSNNMLNYD